MMRMVSVGFHSACATRGRAARLAAPARTVRRLSCEVMNVSDSRLNIARSLRGGGRGAKVDAHIRYARLFAAENLEHVSEVGEFLAAGRRLAADVIENFAVLQAVVRDALDAAVLVEINCDHPLIDDPLGQERR